MSNLKQTLRALFAAAGILLAPFSSFADKVTSPSGNTAYTTYGECASALPNATPYRPTIAVQAPPDAVSAKLKDIEGYPKGGQCVKVGNGEGEFFGEAVLKGLYAPIPGDQPMWVYKNSAGQVVHVAMGGCNNNFPQPRRETIRVAQAAPAPAASAAPPEIKVGTSAPILKTQAPEGDCETCVEKTTKTRLVEHRDFCSVRGVRRELKPGEVCDGETIRGISAIELHSSGARMTRDQVSCSTSGCAGEGKVVARITGFRSVQGGHCMIDLNGTHQVQLSVKALGNKRHAVGIGQNPVGHSIRNSISVGETADGKADCVEAGKRIADPNVFPVFVREASAAGHPLPDWCQEHLQAKR